MNQGGVTHVFVNLGSDHPSILEAMVKGQREKKDQFPTIITCPNEVRQRLHHFPTHAFEAPPPSLSAKFENNPNTTDCLQ